MTVPTTMHTPRAEPHAPVRGAGRALVALGLTLVVLGAAVAAVLFYVAGQRYDDAVERLARAPVGCETTLEVSDTDTYYVYVETTGSLDELPGGCEGPGSYDRDDDAPRVRVEISDGDGEPIDLDRVAEFDYDAAGFAGRAIRRVELVTPGAHVVRVTSAEFDDDPTEADFVVAIGRDPDDSASPLRAGALALGASGVVLGLAAIVIGLVVGRRASRPASPAPGSWSAHPPVPPWTLSGPPMRTGPPPPSSPPPTPEAATPPVTTPPAATPSTWRLPPPMPQPPEGSTGEVSGPPPAAPHEGPPGSAG